LTATRPRLHRNVWITSVTSFLTDVSSEMIFNLLPLFLANVLGVRTGAIGVVEGVAESVSSLLKIVSGFVSDLAGARKWLAVLGYGISAASKPFLYAASSWEAVLGVRAADRIGKGVRSAPRDALLAESVSAGDRGLAFGLHRAFDSGGAFVGVLVAAGVVWSAQRGALSLERGTFQVLVLASIVPAFAAVLVLAVGAEEVAAPRHPGKRLSSSRFSLRGLDPSFRRFLLAMLVFTLGNSSDAFLVLRAQERGLSVVGILGMLLGFNFVYTLVAAPAGRLSDSLGRKSVITAGWIVYGLLYIGFAFVETAWQVVALFSLYGIYYGLTEGGGRAFVADLVHDSEKLGSSYGLYHAAVGTAALPASLLAGVLWQGVGSFSGLGPRAPFFCGAVLALVATVLLATIPAPVGVLSSKSKKGQP
jgi:MFS family permease